MRTADRIKGRLVEIEIEEVEGFGWIAVGTVQEGLSHEKGLRFEAKAADPIEAEQQLKGEVEAYFA